MFNTYYNSRTEYVPYTKEVKITEHRAATDKSVELLNEMQEKAKSNIIATINIDNNDLKAIAIVFWNDFAGNKVVIHLKFQLNGREYICKEEIDGHDWRDEVRESNKEMNLRNIYSFLFKRFSEVIAGELMSQCSESLNRQLRQQIQL